MKFLASLAFMAFVAQVCSFAGSEDKFIKKYAMMKIYESCFGEDVVKQIRKELKVACAKCAALEVPAILPTSTPPPPEERPQPRPQAQEEDIAPNSVYHSQPNFDAEKLHQAIMAFRPNPVPQPSFRPYGPASFYNPPFSNPGFGAPGPMFYPGFQQVPFNPYSFPVLGQQYIGSRIARGMDFKSQLHSLPHRLGAKFRNVSCVMQELGYLDENFEPNYVKISDRISNLPVSEELRHDMQDGVTFCQQFSQCVPEIKKPHLILSRELIRPMFFFKCYKHKKLEACIMKDLRQKYGSVDEEDPVDEDDEDILSKVHDRQGKDMKFSENNKEVDELAATIYEFLYSGESGFDIDGLF